MAFKKITSKHFAGYFFVWCVYLVFQYGKNLAIQKTKEKARMVEKPEDKATVIQDLKQIIRSNKKGNVWLAYQQGMMFRKFKEREHLWKWSRNLASVGQKFQNSPLSFNFFKNHLKTFREIRKENATVHE